MKWIPPAPPEIFPKDDKVIDEVSYHKSKTYEGKYDPVELEK